MTVILNGMSGKIGQTFVKRLNWTMYKILRDSKEANWLIYVMLKPLFSFMCHLILVSFIFINLLEKFYFSGLAFSCFTSILPWLSIFKLYCIPNCPGKSSTAADGQRSYCIPRPSKDTMTALTVVYQPFLKTVGTGW